MVPSRDHLSHPKLRMVYISRHPIGMCKEDQKAEERVCVDISLGVRGNEIFANVLFFAPCSIRTKQGIRQVRNRADLFH